MSVLSQYTRNEVGAVFEQMKMLAEVLSENGEHNSANKVGEWIEYLRTGADPKWYREGYTYKSLLGLAKKGIKNVKP